MILANTVTSAAVQGATVPAAADDNPLLGLGVVGTGRNWVSTPSPNYVLSAIGTVTTAVNIDWTAAGYFTLTLTATDTCVMTFGIGSSSGSLSASLGQSIKIAITGASTAAITWPSTITWIGSGSASAPTVTGNVTVVELVCTGVGSSPTFNATYLTS